MCREASASGVRDFPHARLRMLRNLGKNITNILITIMCLGLTWQCLLLEKNGWALFFGILTALCLLWLGEDRDSGSHS